MGWAVLADACGGRRNEQGVVILTLCLVYNTKAVLALINANRVSFDAAETYSSMLVSSTWEPCPWFTQESD